MNATTTTTTPATVRDLAEYAAARGVQPSEIMPPTGFTVDESSFGDFVAGYWTGPAFQGNQWKVTSFWTAEEGITFYVDGDGDNAIQGAEAAKIAAALAKVAAMVAA